MSNLAHMGETLKIQNKVKVSCMVGTIVMTIVDCPQWNEYYSILVVWYSYTLWFIQVET